MIACRYMKHPSRAVLKGPSGRGRATGHVHEWHREGGRIERGSTRTDRGGIRGEPDNGLMAPSSKLVPPPGGTYRRTVGATLGDRRGRTTGLAMRGASGKERRCAGEMAERLKAHAWKACVRESVPWVRIPLSPPDPIFRIFSIITAHVSPPFDLQPDQHLTNADGSTRRSFWDTHGQGPLPAPRSATAPLVRPARRACRRAGHHSPCPVRISVRRRNSFSRLNPGSERAVQGSCRSSPRKSPLKSSRSL